jgi:hypothetical protein
MTGYRLDDWDSIPGRGHHFLFYTIPRLNLQPTQPPIKLVLEIKWPRHETDHSPLSSGLAKKVCSFTSTLPYIFTTLCFSIRMTLPLPFLNSLLEGSLLTNDTNVKELFGDQNSYHCM